MLQLATKEGGGLLVRLKSLFTVNSKSREAILGLDFRSPAPSSQAEYKAPTSSNEDPKVFHYYPRDQRRNIPATTIIEGIQKKNLLTTPLSEQNVITDASNTTIAKVRPPTSSHPYNWQTSRYQPDRDTYFTIQNYQ